MKGELFYRGKNINDLSKKYLLKAVQFLYEQNDSLLNEKQHERDMLLSGKMNPRGIIIAYALFAFYGIIVGLIIGIVLTRYMVD